MSAFRLFERRSAGAIRLDRMRSDDCSCTGVSTALGVSDVTSDVVNNLDGNESEADATCSSFSLSVSAVIA